MTKLNLLACIVALGTGLSGCSADLDIKPFTTPDAGADEDAPRQPKKDPEATLPSDKRDAATESEDTTGDDDAPASGDKPAAMGGDAQQPSALQLPAADHGSAVAFTPDDTRAVVVNRDAGSISVLALSFDKDAVKTVQLVKELSLGEGSEPYQVAISADGNYAYVVLRREQQLVKIGGLGGAPYVMGQVAVGSEPTAVVVSGDGRYAYVANWNDGTVSQVETSSLSVTYSYDLNAALVKTGYLGKLQPRAALAHPRSIALRATDKGDVLYVTEFFAQQIEAELADGSNSDTRKVGLVYRIDASAGTASTIRLSALPDLGFLDENGGQAGCYPNQLQAIGLRGDYAYVVSVCASPKGPLGAKVTTTACKTVDDCTGLQEPACVTPFAGAPNDVCVDVASVKTTTAPVISIIDTRSDKELGASGVSLNARFAALYKDQKTEAGRQRFPLFASDLAFVPGASVGYVSANGADAVFRFTVGSDGQLAAVGGSTNLFIDLAPTGIAADKAGRNPIGLGSRTRTRRSRWSRTT